MLGNNTNDTDCNFYAGYGQSAHRYFVAGNGNVTNVNNSYGAYSDEKLKENISDASSQWDDIKALKIRKYKLKKLVSKDYRVVPGGDNLTSKGYLVPIKDLVTI